MANLRANKIVSTTGSNAITGSVEFDGTDDRLTFSSSSDFAFGTGDFTVGLWFNSGDVSSTSQRGFIQTSDTSGGLKTTYTSGFAITNGMNKSGTGLTGGLAANIIGTWIGSAAGSLPIVSVNSWNHCALTRSSGVVRLFLNGVLIDSATISGSIDGTNLVIGGHYSTSYLHKGFISNLRIIKGTALYTQNFIPPTAELKNVPGTVLLCCQNPSSAAQEATGKTITVNGNATARNFAPAVGSDGSITFDGVTKISTENYFYLPTGNTEDRGRGRGLFGGGEVGPSVMNNIEYITISSTGRSTDFGDLTLARNKLTSFASTVRGFWAGGSAPSTNVIDFVTISSTSNATDFGDLLSATDRHASLSNSTRGLIAKSDATSEIQYVTMASKGDSIDFGDMFTARNNAAGCSSPTRGLFAGGFVTTPTTVFYNVIDYVTIASTGNAQDFGDLTVSRMLPQGASSPTRGVFIGGANAPAYASDNTIDYVTIATLGDAKDFGDLVTAGSSGGSGAASNSIYAVADPSGNSLEYITIASTGNAKDFGDLSSISANYTPGCSDSHGGLG